MMRKVYGIMLLISLTVVWGMLQTEPKPVMTETSGAAHAAPEVIHARAKAIPASNVIPLGRITYYNAVPEQTDDDPEVSACGPTRERQIAVSRDLFRSVLQCGDRVRLFVNGVDQGEYIVWDTMARRWTATADVLMPLGTIPTWGGLGKGSLLVVE